jgi:hypothetical protein
LSLPESRLRDKKILKRPQRHKEHKEQKEQKEQKEFISLCALCVFVVENYRLSAIRAGTSPAPTTLPTGFFTAGIFFARKTQRAQRYSIILSALCAFVVLNT